MKMHDWDFLWKKCRRCGITLKQVLQSLQGCTADARRKENNQQRRDRRAKERTI
jgi:hypothetical protein